MTKACIGATITALGRSPIVLLRYMHVACSYVQLFVAETVGLQDINGYSYMGTLKIKLN